MTVSQEGGGQPQNLEALVAKILKDEESRKKQQAQINHMESNLRIIGNLICDESGKCRLATKEDLAKVSEKQVPTADLNQLSNKQLYGQLSKSKVAVQDLEDLHLQKLKENEDYLKKALGDTELVERMATIICNDEGCKVVWNTSVDKVKAGGNKGKKAS